MAESNPADEHGSDIASYPPAEGDGYVRRVGEGSVPLVSGTYGLADDIVKAVKGDSTLGEASAGIAADVGMLAAGAVLAIKDPFYVLADFGLTMVLELVEPLDDMLEMVSGDPDEMDRLERVWEQVQTALEALSGEVKEAVDTKIPSWSGDAADAAREHLSAVQASIWAMSRGAHEVREALRLAKLAAEAIYAVIKSILAELVAWLIQRGVVALANSAWSFGASIAEFVLEGAIRAQQAVSYALQRIREAVGIFGRLVELLRTLFLGKGRSLVRAVMLRALVSTGIQASKGVAVGLFGGEDAPQRPASAAPSGSRCFTVEIKELDTLGAELDGLASNAGDILKVANEAATADLVWGATALIFKGQYDEACANFTESAKKAGSACQNNADRLRVASRTYGDNDSGAAAQFAGLRPDAAGR